MLNLLQVTNKLMLLDVVWIILRETLEASLLMSVLLTIANRERLSVWWLPVALLLGLLGSWFYSIHLAVVSEWFDYVGQEIVNGALQYGIYFALLLVAIILRLIRQKVLLPSKSKALLFIGVVVAVALAFVREGTEIFVFYQGYLANENSLVVATTSGLLGLLIGGCVGALVYYSIVMSPKKWLGVLQSILLVLIAGGMVLQASQLFLQADWLPSSIPVWNTSAWIAEDSILGELLYAMFGYEAAPTQIEVIFYGVASLMFLLIPFVLQTYFQRKSILVPTA